MAARTQKRSKAKRPKKAKAKRPKKAKRGGRTSRAKPVRRNVYYCTSKGCRQVTKARLTRPSPAASATLFPIGTVKKGKDRHWWRVIRSGSKERWSRIPKRLEGNII